MVLRLLENCEEEKTFQVLLDGEKYNFKLTENVNDENIVLQIRYLSETLHPTAPKIELLELPAHIDLMKLYTEICEHLGFGERVAVNMPMPKKTTPKFIFIRDGVLNDWLTGGKNILRLGSVSIPCDYQFVGDEKFIHVAQYMEAYPLHTNPIIILNAGKKQADERLAINLGELEFDDPDHSEDVFIPLTGGARRLIEKLCGYFEVPDKKFYVTLGGKKYFYDSTILDLSRTNISSKYIVVPDEKMRNWLTSGNEYMQFGNLKLPVSDKVRSGINNNYLLIENITHSEPLCVPNRLQSPLINVDGKGIIYYSVEHPNPPVCSVNFDKLPYKYPTSMHSDVMRNFDNGPFWEFFMGIAKFFEVNEERILISPGNITHTLYFRHNPNNIHPELFAPEKRLRDWLVSEKTGGFNFGKSFILVKNNISTNTRLAIVTADYIHPSDITQQVIKYTNGQQNFADTFYHLKNLPDRELTRGLENIFCKIYDALRVGERECIIQCGEKKFNFYYRTIIPIEPDPEPSISSRIFGFFTQPKTEFSPPIPVTPPSYNQRRRLTPLPGNNTEISISLPDIIEPTPLPGTIESPKKFLYTIIKNHEIVFSTFDSTSAYQYFEKNGGSLTKVEVH